jgi:hypothetical protein
MKFCRLCNRELPLSEFTKDRHKRDGLSSTCRYCRRLVNYKYARCRTCRKFRSAMSGQQCRKCYCGGKAALSELSLVAGCAPRDREISLRDILEMPMGDWANFGTLRYADSLETPTSEDGGTLLGILASSQLSPEALLIQKEEATAHSST